MNKTIKAMVAALAILVTGVASAYNTEVVDGIKWTYTVSDGEASVGSGRWGATAVPESTAGAIAVPTELGGYTVTSIGRYAFSDCSLLTSVTIPSSVTDIGEYAFWSCDWLKSVTIPSSVTGIGDYAFYRCGGLTRVTIPSSVTYIGEHAFYGCSGLTSVTIPEGVTSIGEHAFSCCSGLTSVTIPFGVTSIGEWAFWDCSGLTSVTIPSSVTSIGEHAFSCCSGLTSVTIPSSVTCIGEHAFQECDGLTSMTIPSSVTNIGEGAFASCSGLHELAVDLRNPKYKSAGGMLFTIDGSQLVGCVNEAVVIPDGVAEICGYAFCGCGGLTSVTIPASVTSIGHFAFYECNGLTSLTIPSSVTSIGEWAFGCSGLKSVTILNGMTSIGSSAFCGCHGLTSVTIPSSVTDIGEYAFRYCSGLTSVDFEGAPPNGLVYSAINEGVAIRYNAAYADEWLPVIDECGFTNAMPYKAVTCFSVRFNANGGSGAMADQRFEYGVAQALTVNSFVRDGYVFAGWGRDNNARPTWSDGEVVSNLTEVASGVVELWAVWEEVRYTGPYTEVVDGIKWTYTVSNGTASVGGASTSTNGVITIPPELGGFPVTSIGRCAFDYCSGLTSVTIPSGVTSIGEYAFEECSGLTSVTIPSSVTSIGRCAFYQCSGLTSVTIPSSVTSIGVGAFSGCSGLREFVVDEANPNYKSVNGLLLSKDGTELVAGINGDVAIPGGVTRICYGAFGGCSGLTSVTIPSSVTSIGEWAFWDCSGLTSVTIPEGVTSIGEHAFSCCSGLTSVTIPFGVTSIGEWAFWDCSGLTSVTIPSSVTSIGEHAFSCCSGLTSVTIPSSVESVGLCAFCGCSGLNEFVVDEANPNYKSVNGLLLSKDGTELVAGVNGDVTIPFGVTSIGQWAFAYLSGLTSVMIPSSVTSIGDSAFYYCTGLTSMTMPSSVTSIGEDAFEECGVKTIYVDEGDETRVRKMLDYWIYFGDVVVKVRSDSDVEAFDGSVKHTFNGLVYDSGVMCGMIQIATAKATKKGVRVSGSVILEDGKKQSIKAVTVAISGGQLVVNTTVGKLGTLQVTIGGNCFEGTLGDMTVATADLDEETGVLSATVKLMYFDAKTGNIKTKSYKLTGVTSGVEAVGSVSLKSDVKEFEAVVK